MNGFLPAVAPFDLRTSIRFRRGFGACKGDQVLHHVRFLTVAEVGLRAVLSQRTPLSVADAALRGIRGVGEFTAGAILQRGLGRMDAVPLSMRQFTEPARAHVQALYGDQLGYWACYLRVGVGGMLA